MAATWGMKNDKLTSLHNQNADNIINNLLLFNENDEIKVVKSLLDTLVEGKFDLWTNCIIKSPTHIHIIIFGLLPRLKMDLQIHLLDTFINIVERHVRNAEICRKYKLTHHIITMLLSKEKFVKDMLEKLEKRFIRLLEAIGKHSITTFDLFHYFRPFSHQNGSQVSDVIIDTMLGTAMSTQQNRPPPCVDMDSGGSIRNVKNANDNHLNETRKSTGKSTAALAAAKAFDQDNFDSFLTTSTPNEDTSNSNKNNNYSNYNNHNNNRKSHVNIHLEKVKAIASKLNIISQNGIVILPNIRSWPSGGYTICLFLRPEGVVDRVSDPLFIFRGKEGHGVSAYIVGRHLLLKTMNGKGNDVEVLVENIIDARRWRWLCITHVSRALWRSKISVFIDGQNVFSKRQSYPVAASMTPLNAYIGGFQGQMGPILVFNTAISDAQVQNLFHLASNPRFSVGPPPKHWRRGFFHIVSIPSPSPSFLASSPNKKINAGNNSPKILPRRNKTAIDEGEVLWKSIYDKIIFAYDPRHRVRHRGENDTVIQLLDLSCNGYNGTLLSPDQGTRLISTNFLLQDAVACGGGAFCLFLPLLLPAVQSGNDFNWPLHVVDHVKCVTPSRFVRIVRLLSALLRNSDTNLVQLSISNGVNILSWILKNSDTNMITLDLWSAINELTNVIIHGPDHAMASDAVSRLMFNLQIWSLATFEIQSQILSALQSKLSLASYVLRSSLVQSFLDSLKLIYKLRPAMTNRNSSHSTDTHGISDSQYCSQACKGFSRDELFAMRRGVLTLIETLVTEDEDRNLNVLYDHIVILLSSVRDRKVVVNSKDILELLVNLMARSERLPNTLRCLVYAAAGQCFVMLLGSNDEHVRKYGLKLTHLLFAQRRLYNLKQLVKNKDSGNSNNPLQQDQEEDNEFSQLRRQKGMVAVGSGNDYGYQGTLNELVAAEMKYNLLQNPYTISTHIGLMEFLCSSKLENHLVKNGKQYVSSLQSEHIHEETSLVLDIILELTVKSDTSSKMKLIVLRDLCILVRANKRNRELIRQNPLYLKKIISLLYGAYHFVAEDNTVENGQLNKNRTISDQTKKSFIKAILSPTQSVQSIALWMDKLGTMQPEEAWDVISEILRKAGSKLQSIKVHVYEIMVNFVTEQLPSKVPNLIYEFIMSIMVEIIGYNWISLEHLLVSLKQTSEDYNKDLAKNIDSPEKKNLNVGKTYFKTIFSGEEAVKTFFRQIILRVLKRTYNLAKHKLIVPERLPKDGALRWDGASKAAKTWNDVILLLHSTTDFVLGDTWGNARSVETNADDVELISATLLLWGALAGDLGSKPGSGVDEIPDEGSHNAKTGKTYPCTISGIIRPLFPNVVQRLLQLVFHMLQIDCQGIEALGASKEAFRFQQSAVHIASILQRLLHMINVLDHGVRSEEENEDNALTETRERNQKVLLWMIPILHSLILRVRGIEISISNDDPIVLFRQKMVEIIGDVITSAEEILRRKGGDKLFESLVESPLSSANLDTRLSEWEMYLCNPMFLNTKMKFEETIGTYRKQLNNYQTELLRIYKTLELENELINDDAMERMASGEWKKILSQHENDDLHRLRNKAKFEAWKDHSAKRQSFKILNSLALSHNPWTWRETDLNDSIVQKNQALTRCQSLNASENKFRMRVRIDELTEVKDLLTTMTALSENKIMNESAETIDDIDDGLHALKSRSSLDENFTSSEFREDDDGENDPKRNLSANDTTLVQNSELSIGAHIPEAKILEENDDKAKTEKVLEAAEIAFGQSSWQKGKNEKITFGTIAELILPMCVVKGRVELSSEALYFYGEGFGGAGQDTSSKQIDAKALLRERWIDDDSSNKCFGCQTEIKSGIISSGKHHCRCCGGIFCAECTKHECVLPSLGFHEPVRVCEKCFEREQKKRGGEGVLSIVAQHYSRVLESATTSTLESLKTRRILLNDIIDIRAQRYLLRPCALEIVANERRTAYLFNFVRGKTDAERFFQKLMSHKPLQLASFGLFGIGVSLSSLSPKNILSRTNWTTKWKKREISNFEYLMKINTIAGRTYNDLTQYPVFPWIIRDYESNALNLSDASIFRDLKKPVGALNPVRLNEFISRYEQLKEDPGMITPFMYGTHYSNLGSVLYYLIRLEPFTKYSRDLQGGELDHAERLFHSISETWGNVLNNPNDLKELIPEFFYLAEMFENVNKVDLGNRQDGTRLGHVKLPPWAKTPEDFVRINREALESEYVSSNLHNWIDLIFGYKQTGDEASNAFNVFYHLTYEGAVDVDAIQDPIQRRSVETQIANFGQMPSQIFSRPHPMRISLKESLQSSDGVVIGLYQVVQGPVSVILLSPEKDEVIAINDTGYATTLEFLQEKPSFINGKNFPFTFTLSNSQTFRPLGDFPPPRSKRVILGPKGRSIISGGFFDWTIKVTNLNYKPSSVTAVNNSLPIIQSIYHHRSHVTCLSSDILSKPRKGDEDGDAYVVAGSNDGTITIWEFMTPKSHDGKFDVLTKLSNNFSVIDDVSGPLQWIHGHRAKVTCVALQVDLGIVISGTSNGICLMHDVWSGDFLRSLNVIQWEEGWGENEEQTDKRNTSRNLEISSIITSLSISKTGKIVIATESCVHIFRLNGVHICGKQFNEKILFTHISADSRFIIVITQFLATGFWMHNFDILQTFCLVDKSMGEHIVESAAGTILVNSNITSSALSNEGKALFVGLQNGSILCVNCKLNWNRMASKV